MYYIAGVTEDGTERACDFGFDMIERILLDDILVKLPERVNGPIVVAKRFSYFGSKPEGTESSLLGMSSRQLGAEYNINVLREHCLATVVARENLLAVLRRGLIRVLNAASWRCGPRFTEPKLFSDLVVFCPRFLYGMLGREKYGVWNHDEDRTRALRVLYKFMDFLYASDDLRDIVIYNELMCPHWEASGEMHFNSSGRLIKFNYFGPGNGQWYKYHPRVEAWERRR